MEGVLDDVVNNGATLDDAIAGFEMPEPGFLYFKGEVVRHRIWRGGAEGAGGAGGVVVA